jgi:hypothetical protein
MSLGGELALVSPGAPIDGVAGASSANGTSVEVWIPGSGANREIYAQRLSQTKLSVTMVGSPIPISAGQLSDPSVAMDSHGKIVVTWTQTLIGKRTVTAIVGCVITAQANAAAPFVVATSGVQALAPAFRF